MIAGAPKQQPEEQAVQDVVQQAVAQTVQQTVQQTVLQTKRSSAAIGEFIREQREQGQVSLRQLARLAGVSNPYLSQIERGLRKPSAEILQQIAKGLRISAEQLYVRAGILEFREGNPEIVAAIVSDDELNERQKQVLLDIYESFRRENARDRADDPHDPGALPHAAGS